MQQNTHLLPLFDLLNAAVATSELTVSSSLTQKRRNGKGEERKSRCMTGEEARARRQMEPEWSRPGDTARENAGMKTAARCVFTRYDQEVIREYILHFEYN